MPLAPEIGNSEAFEALYELLRTIAAGRAADRSEAVLYSACRSVLLANGHPNILPGFVHQCQSVSKFRDFITLYDPDPDVRERFIRDAFKPIRAQLDVRIVFDAPQSAKRASDEWNF